MIRVLACLFATAMAVAADDVGADQYPSGKLSEAEQTLRRASEENPQDARSQLYLIFTLAEQNRSKEAGEVAAALEKAFPDSEWARLGRARVLIQRKDFDLAGDALNSAKAANAGSAELAFLSGLLELARRNHAAAADHFEAAIDKDPRNAYAHYYAGLTYQGLKRPDKMLEHFRRFLKLAPDAAEARKVQSFLRAVQ